MQSKLQTPNLSIVTMYAKVEWISSFLTATIGDFSGFVVSFCDFVVDVRDFVVFCEFFLSFVASEVRS